MTALLADRMLEGLARRLRLLGYDCALLAGDAPGADSQGFQGLDGTGSLVLRHAYFNERYLTA